MSTLDEIIKEKQRLGEALAREAIGLSELRHASRRASAVNLQTAKYDGRHLAPGGRLEILEGDWKPCAIVIVEVPDVETARASHRSVEYAMVLEVRDQGLSRNLILVERRGAGLTRCSGATAADMGTRGMPPTRRWLLRVESSRSPTTRQLAAL
jgi:uncharacterized protein (DUF1330 family)